ncbi:hypothetical protein GOB13_23460 [Sinorhizobium meliloti]|uniref:hypothetical protein n=1 Tax=Rhizobium meliloti TaxID=382 RepID=UPI00299D61E6|nr:hypothetical protein [Sinorhizobium meliloti]MDX0084246.1 hypothetical protein [Sinorhizobium meliloti]MDX0469465.1 hypothetical protein [Sinorhizobium medicae]MDX1176601.1 hypothetical protein [Sinorhizobium medicae]
MRTVESRPVRGYGLTIYNDGAREVCAFLDGSPVLAPAGVEKDGDLRRIRFAEGTRQLRSMGDIFCPDFEIAGFVRQALNEKLERDRDAANAFVVTGSRVSRRRCYLFLTVDARFLKSGGIEHFTFTLEAPSYEVQRDGQQEFAQFLSAVGLSSIEDSVELHGLEATLERRGDVVIFKRWAA